MRGDLCPICSGEIFMSNFFCILRKIDTALKSEICIIAMETTVFIPTSIVNPEILVLN